MIGDRNIRHVSLTAALGTTECMTARSRAGEEEEQYVQDVSLIIQMQVCNH